MQILSNFAITNVRFSRYREIWREVRNEHYIYWRKLSWQISLVVITRSQFWPSGIVVACVCVCMCVCVCVSVNHELVRAIIHQPFKLGLPNLVQRSKTPWLRSLLFFGGNWPWPSRSNLTSNSKLTPFWACPNHYSPPILVRISKLGQEMHFSTVKIPVNSGLDWPWTSPSFLIPKLIFFALWRCALRLWNSPWLFQFFSGTVSQSLHRCTWGTHNQSGMGPLVPECLIWISSTQVSDSHLSPPGALQSRRASLQWT